MSENKDSEVFNSWLTAAKDEHRYDGMVDADSLELEAVSGLPVLGKLTSEEINQYLNVLGIEMRIEELTDEIQSQVNTQLAKDILDHEGTLSPDIVAALRNGNLGTEFAEEFFFLVSLHRYKESEFWFRLRQRLQTFANNLSIRAGYNVVVTGSKTGA